MKDFGRAFVAACPFVRRRPRPRLGLSSFPNNFVAFNVSLIEMCSVFVRQVRVLTGFEMIPNNGGAWSEMRGWSWSGVSPEVWGFLVCEVVSIFTYVAHLLLKQV